MIQLIPISDSSRWEGAVTCVPQADVYYLRGYVRAFEINGDGEPVLLKWVGDDNVGICVLMLRDIAKCDFFKGEAKGGEYFDATTPYGYGGFIFKNKPSEEELKSLKIEFSEFLKSQNIVSVFFRFHPVLKNADDSRGLLEVIDLGKTIALDLKDEDTIWSNIISKNRNMIRKAEKNGIEIKHGKGVELLRKFMEIYNQTMCDDNAEEYYFFPWAFYESIDKDLSMNYEIFYAEYQGEIIAASIMIFHGESLNYHLSGSVRAYRNLAPSNLMLYKAALWGREHGMKTFHLGGGVGSGEDNLYKFKAAFNRNSDYQFSIGKLIVIPDIYDRLVEIRQKDPNFNTESKFFPLYRS